MPRAGNWWSGISNHIPTIIAGVGAGLDQINRRVYQPIRYRNNQLNSFLGPIARTSSLIREIRGTNKMAYGRSTGSRLIRGGRGGRGRGAARRGGGAAARRKRAVKSKAKRAPKGYSPSKRAGVSKRSRKGGPTNTLKGLLKRVKKLEARNPVATLTVRNTVVGYLNCTANQMNQTALVAAGTGAQLQGAMASMRFYDPATNALVTANPSVLTAATNIQCSVFTKMKLRNNYVVPVEITLIYARPKILTSDSIGTSFANSMTDQQNPSITSGLVNVSDALQLKKEWSIKMTKKLTLDAGKEVDYAVLVNKFKWMPSFYDTNTEAYNPKANGYNWYLRVYGVMAHIDTAITQGRSPAAVDWEEDVTYVFTYDAGVALKDYVVTNGGTAIATANVGACPIPDNVVFSYT